jgi:hypothetical protein
MDDTELFKMSGASAGTVAIVLLIYRILKSVSGKRFVSTCCGRKAEIGFDVRNATPIPKVDEEVKIQIKNPIHQVDGIQPSERTQRQESSNN